MGEKSKKMANKIRPVNIKLLQPLGRFSLVVCSLVICGGDMGFILWVFFCALLFSGFEMFSNFMVLFRRHPFFWSWAQKSAVSRVLLFVLWCFPHSECLQNRWSYLEVFYCLNQSQSHQKAGSSGHLSLDAFRIWAGKFCIELLCAWTLTHTHTYVHVAAGKN